tara:strand:+ start:3864 stop:4025 length:162 start_codon:yes stop_codon:yes gene_type:complete
MKNSKVAGIGRYTTVQKEFERFNKLNAKPIAKLTQREITTLERLKKKARFKNV